MKIDPAFGAEYKEAVEKGQKIAWRTAKEAASRIQKKDGRYGKGTCSALRPALCKTSIIRSEPG